MKDHLFYEIVKNYLYICSIFKVQERYFDELGSSLNEIALCSEKIYNSISYSEKLINPNFNDKKILPVKIKPIVSNCMRKRMLEMGLSKSSLSDIIETSKKDWINIFLAKINIKKNSAQFYKLSEKFENLLFVTEDWIDKHLIPENTEVILKPNYII